MIEANRELIDECYIELKQRRARGADVSKDWDALHELVDEYTLACRLSQGKDKSRGRHWAVKAKDVERRLKKFLDGLTA